ncbi:MlaD family protein [Thiorhodospira sibirica]|uniref:MlaD family protein n=1 Tax=Thiorhodospira sibirica TaxID=154347 RepID=UPI00022C5968|nr:MlaD family protein [Thiorhodospira sibirica]
MSSRANYFRLGLFILSSIGVGVAILVLLGVGALLRPTLVLETYFDSSVQGLDIGAPLKLRGVKIGEISHIGFSYNRYQQDLPLIERRQYVMVQTVVRRDLLGAMGEFTEAKALQSYIDRGLRVRITGMGVTGLNFLELDFLDPNAFPVLEVDWQPYDYYIPSAPSTVGHFMQQAEGILRRLEGFDIEGTLGNLNELLENLDGLVSGFNPERLSNEFIGVAAQLNQAGAQLNTLLASPALQAVPKELQAAVQNFRTLSENPKLNESINSLNQALQGFERVMQQAERTLISHEGDVAAILENLRGVTDNLHAFSEDLRTHPGMLLQRAPAPAVDPAP